MFSIFEDKFIREMRNPFFLLLFLLIGCSEPKIEISRAFYFWENDTQFINEDEESTLEKLKIEKLYVKVFEVERIDGVITPIAKSSLKLDLPHNKVLKELIPCIYIQDDVFVKASKNQIKELAENIAFLAKKYIVENIGMGNSNFLYNEIQIDCDWTESSKKMYFYFLKRMKEESKKEISCTLRLYPYKFHEVMGIPPCDKVMLMCYNLLNPLNNANKNSILDTDEMSKYLDTDIDYPIHIDIALPIYSWMLCYENERFRGVIHGVDEKLLSYMSSKNDLWYTMERDTVVSGVYMRMGDRVKVERITKTQLNKAIELIQGSSVLKNETVVSLFHLESKEINNYQYETLDSIYSAFSR